MRFIANGPNIPDLLLEKRDQGRVVFLCGAGVSVDANMPTFIRLTKQVIDYFDPPVDSPINTAFAPWVSDNEAVKKGPKTPLDQIFHSLCREYGRYEVCEQVAANLTNIAWEPSDDFPDRYKRHKTIAAISADLDGRPQIVTTNFDHLFEKTDLKGGGIYFPPALPNIALGVPLHGITYLHGRLDDDENALKHDYILSSADLGRAYLAEAWATNFIRTLLHNYTVVLVGYKAEDPTVDYLLQGLNHDGKSDRSNLYAFVQGASEQIEAKWRDRGVTSIAYSDHSQMWASLEAWAERAANTRKWKQKIIDLALKGPRYLEAHERGQVVHLVRTTDGAKLFANNTPVPPAEWLCVFDSACRIAKQSINYGETPNFDALAIYGLDDDPQSDKRDPNKYDNVLIWRHGDKNPPGSYVVGQISSSRFLDMPPRLLHLISWISKWLDNPLVAWWALRPGIYLHEVLIEQIKLGLRRQNSLFETAREIWSFILDRQEDSRLPLEQRFYFEDRVSAEGWSYSVLREFERSFSPRLTRSGYFPASPLDNWEDLKKELSEWRVDFPDKYAQTLSKIHEKDLYAVFCAVERNLRKAEDLSKVIDWVRSPTFFFKKITCYPHGEVNGDLDAEKTFDGFLSLFEQLVKTNPVIARNHALLWSIEDGPYLGKLKLFALNQKSLFSGEEVGSELLGVGNACFWDYENRRELIFLIADRWNDLSCSSKSALFERIIAGSDGDDPDNKTLRACFYLKKLIVEGIVFDGPHSQLLQDFIDVAPIWGEVNTSRFFAINGRHLPYAIRIDESSKSIENLPPNEILEAAKIAEAREFGSPTEKRPFQGLIKDKPRKALAALSLESKRGEYNSSRWGELLQHWPSNTKSRLLMAFLNRLCKLPPETIRDIGFAIGSWFKKYILVAYQYNPVLTWQVLDHLVAGLNSCGGVATRSGMSRILRHGEDKKISRRTIEFAINGPVGMITESLVCLLRSLGPQAGSFIPDDIKSRFERLIFLGGEGGDHAVSILAMDGNWLFYIDNNWVINRLMPLFDLEHSLAEPAWSGYFHGNQIFSEDLGMIVKSQILNLFPRIYHWNWSDQSISFAAYRVVELAVLRINNLDGLTAKEVRHCLRGMNDINRGDALYVLGQIGQGEADGWHKYVIPFVRDVWPKERAYRTTSLTINWLHLLRDTKEKFPDVLDAVIKFLTPIDANSFELPHFTKEWGGDDVLTNQFPTDVLKLMDAIIPNSIENLPRFLAEVLEFIEDVCPELAGDRRYVRLLNLVEQL